MKKHHGQASRQTAFQAAPPRAADALVIFAKAPIPGQVKTRLCPPLTPDEAATLHGTFVLDTLERSKSAIGKFRLPVDRFVACWPSASHVFFKVLAARHGVEPLDQIGDELGARMHQVFTELAARGYRRIVLVGTDVPTLPLAHYRQAYEFLHDHDVVLGPARDGGYFLIGLTKPQSDLFRDIRWSTDQVLELTQRRATEAGVTAALLPVWQDVDTLEDLKWLIGEAAKDRKRPKAEQAFSSRTAGALDLMAQRLRDRLR
jgi:rSAM/selenodomain-associated transferase 1